VHLRAGGLLLLLLLQRQWQRQRRKAIQKACAGTVAGSVAFAQLAAAFRLSEARIHTASRRRQPHL
jgi:hypothetical protein